VPKCLSALMSGHYEPGYEVSNGHFGPGPKCPTLAPILWCRNVLVSKCPAPTKTPKCRKPMRVECRPVLSALHSISLVDSCRRQAGFADRLMPRISIFALLPVAAAPPPNDKPIQFSVACSFALGSRCFDSIGLKLLNDSVGR